MSGKKHGQGWYKYSEGFEYKGEYENGKRSGKGVYKYPDGSSYDGEFKDGKMNGRGVYRWPDGSTYEGEWRDNMRHGYGLLTASDKSFYDGLWKYDDIDGLGIPCLDNFIYFTSDINSVLRDNCILPDNGDQCIADLKNCVPGEALLICNKEFRMEDIIPSCDISHLICNEKLANKNFSHIDKLQGDKLDSLFKEVQINLFLKPSQFI